MLLGYGILFVIVIIFLLIFVLLLIYDDVRCLMVKYLVKFLMENMVNDLCVISGRWYGFGG